MPSNILPSTRAVSPPTPWLQLYILGGEENRMAPLFSEGGFERASRPGGAFFEQEREGTADEALRALSAELLRFYAFGKIEEIADFLAV
jgi:hypothetical protein